MRAISRCALTLLVSSSALGITSGAQTDVRPITIGESVTLEASGSGEARELLVCLPSGYSEGEGRYPVLYLLDAEESFSWVTGVVAFLNGIQRAPDLIVVGVANTDRDRDLTPPPGDTERRRFPTSGGGDRFRRFLGDRVIPFIESHYRTEPFRILVGHSLGGLFAIHTMLNEPALFDAFIASSPSLYWNEQQELASAERLLGTTRPAGVLFMAMGNEREEMVSAAEAFVEGLQRYAPPNLMWTFQSLPEEDHSTTAFAAAYRGLEFVFRDYHDFSSLDGMSFQDYRIGLAAKYGFDLTLPLSFLYGALGTYAEDQRFEDAVDVVEEMAVRYPETFRTEAAGYVPHAEGLLAQGQLELAARLLQVIVEVEPGIASAHVALGDVRLRQGSTDAALESYRVGLRLQPESAEIQRKIRELSPD